MNERYPHMQYCPLSESTQSFMMKIFICKACIKKKLKASSGWRLFDCIALKGDVVARLFIIRYMYVSSFHYII